MLRTTATWEVGPVDVDERRAWLATHGTGRHETIVAEVDVRVVGYAGCGALRAGVGYRDTVEHSVYLLPEAQARGLGTRLLTEVVVAARAHRFHVMVGGLSADDEASLRLHRRLGFVETARMPQWARSSAAGSTSCSCSSCSTTVRPRSPRPHVPTLPGRARARLRRSRVPSTSR